jgi:anti-sigma regulatory factor (Ser/Thr protein kinase)
VSDLPLAALATAPACARGHVRSVAYECGLPNLADTAELLTSELVTNAVQASATLKTAGTPVLRIWVTRGQGSLAIHVWDGSHHMPVRQETGPDQTGGRGLMLVEALSEHSGAYREANGKVVWAVISSGTDGP